MNSIPQLFICSVGAALLTIFCFIFFRKLPRPFNHDDDQKFLDAMLSIVGTLISIVIGLLVAFALDHYQAIEQTVDQEAANISQIFRVSVGLDAQTRTKIRALCGEYNQEIIENEWPAMQRGEVSKKAFTIYAKLMATIANYNPQNEGQSNIHASLISSCQELGNDRRQRILVLHSTWIGHVMPVLLMCALIVLIFAFSYIRKGEKFHGFLLSLVALALGGNLGLVFLLSHPFSGEWQIQPRGFELNQQVIQEIQSSPELNRLINGASTVGAPAGLPGERHQ
jgi:multisubunit Na+/H+ antiporter MnhB subunit